MRAAALAAVGCPPSTVYVGDETVRERQTELAPGLVRATLELQPRGEVGTIWREDRWCRVRSVLGAPWPYVRWGRGHSSGS